MAKDKKKTNANEDKTKKHFWKDYKSELKKVKWPTGKELLSSTASVIAIVFIVAAVVIVLDLAFEGLSKLEVEGIESLQNSIVMQDSNTTMNSEENLLSENVITNNLESTQNTVE